jgi:hypothetical protein
VSLCQGYLFTDPNGLAWGNPELKGKAVIKKRSHWIAAGLALFLASRLPAGDFEVIRLKGQDFQVNRDPLTQSPVIIRGIDRPIVTLKGAQTRSRVFQSGPMVIERLRPLLPLTPQQIRLKSAEKIGGLWFISYWQTAGDFIVYGSSLGFSLDRLGRIFSTGSVIYPNIQVPASLKVDREQALQTSIRSIDGFHKQRYKLLTENLIIYPDRKTAPPRYYLVYVFNFFPPREALHPASPEAGWAIFVDTQTGKIVDRQTLLKPLGCCVPEEGPPLTTEAFYKSQIGK